MVRHEILYDDSSGLLGAIVTGSACISLLFTTGLIAFRHKVCIFPLHAFVGVELCWTVCCNCTNHWVIAEKKMSL